MSVTSAMCRESEVWCRAHGHFDLAVWFQRTADAVDSGALSSNYHMADESIRMWAMLAGVNGDRYV